MDVLITIVSGLMIVIGFIGSVLPVLPGPPLSYAGLFVYAWWTGFDRIGWIPLVIFGALTVLTLVVDVISPALGAKGYKASKYGAWGSIIGAFMGMFVLGPIGIILGPFLGAFIGEYIHAQNHERALRVAWGAFVGFLIGSAFRLAVVVAMFGYFIYALF